MKIPGWRIALTGAALAVLTVAGIGLAQARRRRPLPIRRRRPSGGRSSLPAASDADDDDARLRPLRHVVHGTITFDHPEEGLITVQVDGGTISAVDADSMTIAEAGGASVTVAIDDQTRVRLERQAIDGRRAEGRPDRPGRSAGSASGNAATARLIVVRRPAGERPRPHGASAGRLEAGRDAVDRQLDEPEQPIALRIVRRAGSQSGQQHHLERRERVDVRVAKDDPPAKLRVVGEQVLAAGDAGQPAHRQAVLGLDPRPAAGVVVARASAAYCRATPMSARARDSSALSRRLARNGHDR